LTELKDENFYEGWLVNDAGEVLYTGRVELKKGGYILIYETADDLSRFKKIIITREKKDDQRPEKHVLGGEFR